MYFCILRHLKLNDRILGSLIENLLAILERILIWIHKVPQKLFFHVVVKELNEMISIILVYVFYIILTLHPHVLLIFIIFLFLFSFSFSSFKIVKLIRILVFVYHLIAFAALIISTSLPFNLPKFIPIMQDIVLNSLIMNLIFYLLILLIYLIRLKINLLIHLLLYLLILFIINFIIEEDFHHILIRMVAALYFLTLHLFQFHFLLI